MHVDRLQALPRDRWPVPALRLSAVLAPGRTDPEDRALLAALRKIERGWADVPLIPTKVAARYARLVTSLTVDPSPPPGAPTEDTP